MSPRPTPAHGITMRERIFRQALRAMAEAPRMKPGERKEWARLALFIADGREDYGPIFPLNGNTPTWAEPFLDDLRKDGWLR